MIKQQTTLCIKIPHQAIDESKIKEQERQKKREKQRDRKRERKKDRKREKEREKIDRDHKNMLNEIY